MGVQGQAVLRAPYLVAGSQGLSHLLLDGADALHGLTPGSLALWLVGLDGSVCGQHR